MLACDVRKCVLPATSKAIPCAGLIAPPSLRLFLWAISPNHSGVQSCARWKWVVEVDFDDELSGIPGETAEYYPSSPANAIEYLLSLSRYQ